MIFSFREAPANYFFTVNIYYYIYVHHCSHFIGRIPIMNSIQFSSINCPMCIREQCFSITFYSMPETIDISIFTISCQNPNSFIFRLHKKVENSTFRKFWKTSVRAIHFVDIQQFWNTRFIRKRIISNKPISNFFCDFNSMRITVVFVY